MVKDNYLLGMFSLHGIPPMPAGVPQIDISFDLDGNGILAVYGIEKSSGIQNRVTMENSKGVSFV